MKDTQFAAILSTFSRADFKEFKKILESPFHNTSTRLVPLFEVIKKAFFRLNSEHPNDPKAIKWPTYKQILKELKALDSPIHKNNLQGSLRKLFDLALEFIAIMEYKAHPKNHSRYVLSALNKCLPQSHAPNKMQTIIQKNLDVAEKDIDKQTLRNAEYWHLKHLIEVEKHIFYKNINRTLSYSSLNQYLDISYLSQKLKYYSYWLNRKWSRQQHDLGLEVSFQHFGQYFEQFDASLKDFDAIQLFYQAIQHILKGDEQAYQNFLSRIATDCYKDVFEEYELAALYSLALNIFARNANSNLQFFETAFKLYQRLLGEKLLFNKQAKMRMLYYKNIATVALKLGKFDWALTFIEDYRTRIVGQYCDNCYHYNMANYYFSKGLWNESLQRLNHIEISPDSRNNEHRHLYLDTNWLLAKCLYELDETFPSIDKLNTFKRVIERDRFIAQLHKEKYLNSIRLFTKTVRLSFETDRQIKCEKAKNYLQVSQQKSLHDQTYIATVLKNILTKKGR